MRRDLQGLLVAGAVAAALSFVYVVAVGRVLQPAAYADFAAAMAIVYFLGTLASPIGPAFAHFVAGSAAVGRPVTGALWRDGRRRVAGVVAVVGLLILAASQSLGTLLRFDSPAVLVLALLTSLVMPFVLLDRAILQGESRFAAYNWNSMLEAVVRLVVGIGALLLFPRSAAFATAAYLVALVVSLLHGDALVARTVEERLDRDDWRRLGTHLSGTFAVIGTYAVFQNLDMLVVKRFMSPEAAGLYGAVVSLGRTFGIVAWPLNAYLVPRLAAATQRREPSWPIIGRIGGAYLAIAVPLLVLCAIASEPIIRLVYGEVFAPAAPMLFPIMAAAALTTLNLIVVFALSGLRDFRFLIVYIPAALLQMLLFAFRHDTVLTTVSNIWIVQGSVALALTWFLRRALAPERRV